MRKHRIVQVVAVLLYIVALLFLLAGILAAVLLGGSGLGAGWGPGSRLPVIVPIVAIALFNAILFMVLASALFFLAKIENNLSIALNLRQTALSGAAAVGQTPAPTRHMTALEAATVAGASAGTAAAAALAVAAEPAGWGDEQPTMPAPEPEMAPEAEPFVPAMTQAPAYIEAEVPVTDQSLAGTLPWEAPLAAAQTVPAMAEEATPAETPAAQHEGPLSDASVAALVSSADDALVPETPAAALLAAAAAMPLIVPADDETPSTPSPDGDEATSAEPLAAAVSDEAWGVVPPPAGEEPGGPVTDYEAPVVYDLPPVTSDIAFEPAAIAPAAEDWSPEPAAAAEPDLAGPANEPAPQTFAPPVAKAPQVEIDDFEWEDSVPDDSAAELLPDADPAPAPIPAPPPSPVPDFSSRLPGAGEVARIAAENRKARNAARKAPPGDPSAGQ